MKRSSKQRDIEIAMSKKQQRELMTAVFKAMRPAQDWQPAPRDPGIKPGGIRDRAIQAMNAKR